MTMQTEFGLNTFKPIGDHNCGQLNTMATVPCFYTGNDKMQNNSWINQIFQSEAANNGGILRRSKADVKKYGSMESLILEAEIRGCHVLEIGGQILILCSKEPIAILC